MQNSSSSPTPHEMGSRGIDQFSRGLFSPSMFLFIAGLLYLVEIGLVGKLYGTDFALAAYGLSYIISGNTGGLRNKYVGQVLLLGAVWFIGAMVTDIIMKTPSVDYLRGWARIIFLLVDFASLALCTQGSISRIMSFAAGLSVAQIILVIGHPTMEMIANPWKFGYGPALSRLVVIFASLPLSTLLAALAMAFMVAIPVVSLALNSRALFGTMLLSILTHLTARRLSVSSFAGSTKDRVNSFIVLGVALAAVAFAAISGYGALAGNGFLGVNAQDKYLHDQAAGGVLLGGRSESIASIKAITDSPIIGHGSWARDLTYVYFRASMLRQRGVDSTGHYRIVDDLIPTHSYILGSWVEAGIVGGLFWIFVLVLIVRAAYATLFTANRATPFVIYTLFSFAWDVPFSYFGGWTRLFIVMQLCTCIWAIQQLDQKRATAAARRFK